MRRQPLSATSDTSALMSPVSSAPQKRGEVWDRGQGLTLSVASAATAVGSAMLDACCCRALCTIAGQANPSNGLQACHYPRLWFRILVISTLKLRPLL